MRRAMDRRSFIRASVVGSAGAAIGGSGPAAVSGPVPGLPGAVVPRGRIKGLEISRLLLGGNLLTHFTHSRELKYVYTLTRHYNTEEKIIETLGVAEAHGINTVVIHSNGENNILPLRRYRVEREGKIQWIVCPTADLATADFRAQVERLLEAGTEAIYLWGVKCDKAVKDGRPELIGEAVDMVRAHGVPCGVGAHDLDVVRHCESMAVEADFYVKTFHHHEYATAPRPGEIDGPHREIPGYWCADPEATREVMAKVEKPWIAFKVMAAGAIPPPNAFRYAFENGADFVLAGMFDFEVAEDARTAAGILGGLSGRVRPWRA